MRTFGAPRLCGGTEDWAHNAHRSPSFTLYHSPHWPRGKGPGLVRPGLFRSSWRAPASGEQLAGSEGAGG